MPSYTQYLRQMAVLDAKDDDIESWITVKGNHIPIRKGQSKEDAVKSFIEKKEGRKTAYKESRANFRTAAKERDKVIKAIGTYTQKTGKEDIHLEAQKKRLEKTMTHESNVMSKIRKEEEKERTLSLAEKARIRKERAEKRLEKAEPITKYGDIQSEKKDNGGLTKKGITKKYDDVAGKRDAIIKELKGGSLTPKERYAKEREKSKMEKIMVSESEKGTELRKSAELAKERGEKKSESKAKTENKSDSPLVNAVAKALNRPIEEAEEEIEGAAQHIRDLIKAKDLRHGDVEETLLGLGVEPDYAEEFMQWATYPKRKKKSTSRKPDNYVYVDTKHPNVKYVDPKAWAAPANDPFSAYYD